MNQKKTAKDISPGDVYYYSSPEDIVTSIKHYFVCVSRTQEQVVFMVCCTTKYETVKKNLENCKHDYALMFYSKL